MVTKRVGETDEQFRERRRALDRERYKLGLVKPPNKEYQKQWYQENKERLKPLHQKYKEENKQHYIEYRRTSRRKIIDDLILILGGKCVWPNCGRTDDLQPDHIHGGGGTEKRTKFKGQRHEMYKWYITHPELAKEKLQALCKEHNRLKQKVNNESGKDYIVFNEIVKMVEESS